MKDNILYIIVPCYNEHECLNDSAIALKGVLLKLIDEKLVSSKSKIVFVNDGSRDNTWEIIESLHNEDKIFQGVSLSRNKGHQNACLAGLDYAKDYADITITVDADLQDDINTIRDFIIKYNEGYDIVYGVRTSRKKDSFFKKTTANGYYKLLNKMGVEIIYNHADYRLMSKKAVEKLLSFKEVNVFLRGMVPQIGYKSTTVGYERLKRTKGKSKYSLRKMLSLAWDGITSFSLKPLTIILNTGIIFTFLSITALITFSILFATNVLTGSINAYILMSMFLVTGIILIALGIVGEYVGKSYVEIKARPRYIIDKIINDD